jgi:hypothetical protein
MDRGLLQTLEAQRAAKGGEEEIIVVLEGEQGREQVVNEGLVNKEVF